MYSIYGHRGAIKRAARLSALERITSNGTIAALVMVLAALAAVICANSPLYEPLEELLHTPVSVGFGAASVSITLEAIVNDLLMSIFFLLVGVELKYEMTVGQLRHIRQAALPMLAAVGGVIVPVLIYLAFNRGGQVGGWATPIATDIAFALGVMSLLGDRISPATKVFFQTLAIADDILAIVVIAIFYGQVPHVAWCAASAICLVVLYALYKADIYSAKPYLFVGFILWVCMYNSGIHATLAGVALAFFLPSRSDVRISQLPSWISARTKELDKSYDENHRVLGQHDVTDTAHRIERVLHHVTPPLQRMENYFSVLVNFFILPLFAFVNAEIHLTDVNLISVITSPIALGVYFGAVVGKPIGIISVTWLLVKLKFAELPKRVNWTQTIAVGLMGGLGFTMSILISGLAFANRADVAAAKVAILLGSVTAALIGIVFVKLASRMEERKNTRTSV